MICKVFFNPAATINLRASCPCPSPTAPTLSSPAVLQKVQPIRTQELWLLQHPGKGAVRTAVGKPGQPGPRTHISLLAPGRLPPQQPRQSCSRSKRSSTGRQRSWTGGSGSCSTLPWGAKPVSGSLEGLTVSKEQNTYELGPQSQTESEMWARSLINNSELLGKPLNAECLSFHTCKMRIAFVPVGQDCCGN